MPVAARLRPSFRPAGEPAPSLPRACPEPALGLSKGSGETFSGRRFGPGSAQGRYLHCVSLRDAPVDMTGERAKAEAHDKS